MRKKFVLITTCFIVFLSFVGLTACKQIATSIDLPELSYQYTVDDSIPFLSGDYSEELLDNIDRGFRTEVYYTLGSGSAWPTGDKDGYLELKEVNERYKADKPREIQVYIYLNLYHDKPLDDLAFNQMKAYFEHIRSLRMSMLLRFAYDPAQSDWVSPTQDVMLGHLAQLKEFFQIEKRLADDTITALQFGCIGAWGEWGETGGKYDERKVVDAIIDMMPEGTYFQGRYMRVTKLAKKNARYDYVGYHNDFLVGRPHPWNTAGDVHTTADYKYFRKTAQSRMNDGEMPWGGVTGEPNEIIDGRNFLKQMAEHSMNTLSIQHNYIEERNVPIPPPYNIERWKSELLTAADMDAMRLPYDPGYFKAADGAEAKRSVYEYLRDFVGYRLALSNLKIENNGANTKIGFIITNYGLGTPLTLDNAEVVLSTPDGERRLYLNGFDVKKLVSGGQLALSVTVPAEWLQNAKIGVRITRNCSTGDYFVRTANDVPFSGGVNWVA